MERANASYRGIDLKQTFIIEVKYLLVPGESTRNSRFPKINRLYDERLELLEGVVRVLQTIRFDRAKIKHNGETLINSRILRIRLPSLKIPFYLLKLYPSLEYLYKAE